MRRLEPEPIKLGIIGTGRIAGRFVPEAREVDGVVVQAVYHPKANRAEAFALTHQLETGTSDIEMFLVSIDAVYIASPHATHAGYIRTALQHGKHALCEKPMVLRGADASELYAFANDRQLVLMEGIKTAYCSGFNQVLDIARSGEIGEIRDVEAAFTKLTNAVLRELTDTATGGSFLELASYTLLPAIKLLGSDYKALRFESHVADNSVDLYTKTYLQYEHSFATSKTGLGVKSEGQLLISGTKGYIRVNAPWWKTQSFDVCYEDSSQNKRYTAEYEGDGLRYELSAFVSAIRGGYASEQGLSAAESIALAELMEMFLNYRKGSEAP